MKLEPSLESLQQQIELRVLLGPQAGSRLMLAPGDYDLGSGDDCMIILSGPKIELCHARLSFDGATAFITPIEGKICDAQGNELAQNTALILGMPLEIGGIWISVDGVEADWPSPADVIPMMHPSPPAEPLKEAETVLVKSAHLSDKPSSKTKLFIISLAALLVSGVGLLIFLTSVTSDETQRRQLPLSSNLAVAEPPTMKKIRDIVAASGVGSSIEISVTHHQKVLVRGFVPDDQTKQSLQEALAQVSPAPHVNLQADSALMDTAVHLLAEKVDPNRGKLRVASVIAGVLTLEGAVLTSSGRESAIQLLTAGVPGLQHVHSSVLLAEDLPPLLQEQLANAGLLKKLQITDQQPEFVLRGSLSDEEIQRWEALIVKFSEQYGKILPVRAMIKQTSRKPPVHVQAIVGGIMPFVMTESGDRVTRGGDINGNTLLIIKDNEIIFEGAERFRIAR